MFSCFGLIDVMPDVRHIFFPRISLFFALVFKRFGSILLVLTMQFIPHCTSFLELLLIPERKKIKSLILLLPPRFDIKLHVLHAYLMVLSGHVAISSVEVLMSYTELSIYL